MAKIETPPTGYEIIQGAEVFSHGHLPLAAAFCRSLGLIELVNRMVPSEMDLRPGLAVQAMVLDTLSGRTPLYRLEQFMAEQDCEMLLGEDVDPHLFNDNNIGRSLDAIFNAGSSKVITELGIRTAQKFSLDTSVVSYDTTSTSVWGDYLSCKSEKPPQGPVVTHGHSKDSRPDLKQFMTELLCVERGVPLFGKTLNGNSSDKSSNNEMLTRISSIMASHGLGPGAFVYVADSAMITRDNLAITGGNTRFVSRLPATYKACSQAIGNAVNTDNWEEIGRLVETPGTRKRPGAHYKAFETTVELYEKSYRAVVIHSDSHDKRRQKKLDKDLQRSNKELHEKLKKTITMYHCEADALDAAEKISSISNLLHKVETGIHKFEVRRPGRPSKKGSSLTRTKYKLEWTVVANDDAVERRRQVASCFVLISNVATVGNHCLNAKELLRVYKGQYGVESDFGFLKDPIIVNDTFLKSPRHIDALGMVLIIALLVWRLMERSMRAWVDNTGKTLPGWDNKRTTKPTSFMLSKSIYGIQVLLTKDNTRHLLRKPTLPQMEYLTALGLGTNAFIDPRHKCQPIIPLKVDH